MGLSPRENLAVAWSLTAGALLFFIGKIFLRYRSTRSLHWDDLAVFLSWLFFLASVACTQGWLGELEAFAAYMNGTSLQEPDFRHFLAWDRVITLLGWCCWWSVKAAFLILYYKIFHVSKTFQHAWWVVLVFTVLTYFTEIGITVSQCEGSSKKLLDFEACSTPNSIELQRKLYIASTALNVASDTAIMALPLGMLHTLNMKLTQKVGLAFTFGLTSSIIVIELLRLALSLKGNGLGLDELWVAWLEIFVAVVVACLPSYNVLLTRSSRQRLKSGSEKSLLNTWNSKQRTAISHSDANKTEISVTESYD